MAMLELLWLKSLFDFATIFQCTVFVLFLRAKYPQAPSLVKWLLGFLLLKIVADVIGFIQYTSWIQAIVQIPLGATAWIMLLQLCYAPLIYIMCKCVQEVKYRPGTDELKHWIPASIYLLMVLFFPQQLQPNLPYLLLIVEVQFIVYALVGLRGMTRGQRLVQNIRYLLIGLIVWRGLRLLEYVGWLHLNWIEESLAWGIYVLSELVFLSALGYFFLKVIQYPTDLVESNQWALPSALVQQIRSGIQALVERDKIYLDPLLSLDRLAKALQVPPHYLSQYLNRELKKTFNEWLNEHRIEAFKRLALDPRTQGKTIQTLMYEVGFNSKSTFHSAFKKRTGMTPTQYRKMKMTI